MTQEIVYTSASQGLQPGSKGFCTVISTDGLPGNFSERLEMLSGYRHAFTPGDRMAPVNFSHLHIKVAGRTYYVLSRICDAGLDYSQRSNKLAHHVAFVESERVAAGPAGVLAHPGFFETRWDGTVKTLPTGQPPNPPPSGPAFCQHWQSLTGDAGWAGVLAQSATVARSKPISVIFQPGTDVLPLVVEALNLIPPAQRWNVTFSTYFTKAIAGSDCLWRFVLGGTKQAAALKQNAHSLVIDLASQLAAAPNTPYLNAARTGTPNPDYNDHFASPSGPVTERSRAQLRVAKRSEPQSAAGQEESYGDYNSYDEFRSMPAMPPLLPRKQPWYKKTWAAVLGGICLLGLVAGLVYAAIYPNNPTDSPRIERAPVKNELPAESEDDSQSESESAPTSEASDFTPIGESVIADTPEPPVHPAETEIPVPVDPFTVLDGERLPTNTIPFFLSDEATTSRRLSLPNIATIELELSAADSAIENNLALEESSPSGSPTEMREWTVTLETHGGGKGTVLGTFQIDSEQISFNRKVAADDLRFMQFRYSLLNILHKEHGALFVLVPPSVEQDTQVDLAKNSDSIEYLLPNGTVGSITDSLRFDIAHPAFEAWKVRNLKHDDSFVIAFQKDGETVVERPPTNDSVEERATKGVLADIAVQISTITIESSVPETIPTTKCVLNITPSVYLKLVKISDPVTLGERFLHGNLKLLSDHKRLAWNLEDVAERLSSTQGEKIIRGAVRREFNKRVKAEPELSQDKANFWPSVLERIDDYYDVAFSGKSTGRPQSKRSLETLIAVVSNYNSTLTTLQDLTDRFQANNLHVRAYTVVNGHVVDVMETRGNDERN